MLNPQIHEIISFSLPNFGTVRILEAKMWFRLYLPSKWYFERRKKNRTHEKPI